MKVLYIGHLLENSGYSQAAKDYIHALYRTNIDVVCRNIKLNNQQGETSDLVIELLNKPLDGITHCIQHILPHHMSYNSSVKNIGMFIYDTSPCHYEWSKSLQLLDEIWTPTKYTKSAIPSYVNKSLKIVPHTTNIYRFDSVYQKPVVPQVEGTYKFYCVAESNKRKNLKDLVQAFHQEFKRNEPVSLILKTSIPGLSPDESAKIISDECNKIKMETRLYPNINNYKAEVIITERISEEQLNGLHQWCDCFVSTSRGEAWSQPLFDAYAFGNQTIYYDNERPTMYPYLENRQQGRISCDLESCFGYQAAFPWIGTSREAWLSSDIPSLQSNMRLNYEEWLDKKKNGVEITKNKVDVSKYSYTSVGKIMKELLNE